MEPLRNLAPWLLVGAAATSCSLLLAPEPARTARPDTGPPDGGGDADLEPEAGTDADEGADATPDGEADRPVDGDIACIGECCSPTDCGVGDWVCSSFRCQCPGRVCDGVCLGGAECCEDRDCPQADATCSADRRCRCVVPPLAECLTPAGDTYADLEARDTSFADLELLRVRRSNKALQISFLRFDLSHVPRCAPVHAAWLRLAVASAPDRVATVTVRRITSPWGARALTWADRPTLDTVTAADASVGPASPGDAVVWSLDDLVRDWVARPEDNHGVAVRLETNYRAVAFGASEHDTEGFRPCLRVELRDPI